MVGDVNLFFNDGDDSSSAELEVPPYQQPCCGPVEPTHSHPLALQVMIAEPSARRRGLGKQAVCAMMDYASRQLHVKVGLAVRRGGGCSG